MGKKKSLDYEIEKISIVEMFDDVVGLIIKVDNIEYVTILTIEEIK